MNFSKDISTIEGSYININPSIQIRDNYNINNNKLNLDNNSFQQPNDIPKQVRNKN